MINPKLRHKQWLTMIILIVLLLLACAWSMTSGEYKMSMGDFFKTLLGQGNYTDSLILLDFRLPRMLITILAGIALAMSGAVIQSVTRNPLAEPGRKGKNEGRGCGKGGERGKGEGKGEKRRKKKRDPERATTWWTRPHFSDEY